jgi:uncharacterized Tic20 family protein
VGPRSEAFQAFFQAPEIGFPEPGPQDRSWAVATHISGLAGLLPLAPGVLNILAPLVIWLIKRAESPYLDEVGKEVVNFQISWLVYFLITCVFGFLTCGYGFILLVLLVPIWLALVIIAAVKTSDGVHYRYPGAIRFIK